MGLLEFPVGVMEMKEETVAVAAEAELKEAGMMAVVNAAVTEQEQGLLDLRAPLPSLQASVQSEYS